MGYCRRLWQGWLRTSATAALIQKKVIKTGWFLALLNDITCMCTTHALARTTMLCFQLTKMYSRKVWGNKSSKNPMSLENRFKILPIYNKYKHHYGWVGPIILQENNWIYANSNILLHVSFLYKIYIVYTLVWNIHHTHIPLGLVSKKRTAVLMIAPNILLWSTRDALMQIR